MGKIRAAVIGAGTAGMLIHAPYLASNPDVDLVAIVDPVEERAKLLAQKYHTKAFLHHKEMLESENPEVVHVATPVSLHHDQAVDALNAGANVLCEKPMATSLEECDDMIRVAKRNDARLMIGFMKRWNIGLLKIKEILDSEELGKPFFAYAHHTLSASSMCERWQQFKPENEEMRGGGIALGLEHYVDALRWMMGEASFVQGTISNTFPKLINWENFASLTINFVNGVVATVALGAGPTYNFEEGDEGGFFCTKGNIHFKLPGSFSFSSPVVKVQNSSGEWKQIPLKADLVNLTHFQYKKEIDYWINCVKNNLRPSPSGEDGRKAQEIIYALYQSWYTGKRVELPLKATLPLKRIFDKLTNESPFGNHR